MTNTNPTETPIQGHTPEKLPVGVEARDINDGNWDDQHCKRLAACFNACRGLTAEQVAAIPRLRPLLASDPKMDKWIAEGITKRMSAFEAMREALKEIADRFENLEDAYFEETRKWPPEYGTGDLVRARAALKLADDCEGEK